MSLRPAAIQLASGCLVFVLALIVATCRFDKLVKPRVHDRILVSPAAVLDTGNAGSSVEITDTLRLTSADGASLSWTALPTAPWLTLDSSSGGAPDTLIVTLRAAALDTPAVYHDTIAFTAPEAPGDTVSVPVEFTVLDPSPELVVSPVTHSDDAFVGSLQPDTVSVRIGNTGGLPLTWSAAVDTSWLTLSSTSGEVPERDSAFITVTLTPGSLSTGAHAGTVIITGTGAIGSPDTIDVTFQINPCSLTPLVGTDPLVTSAIALSDCGAPDRSGSLAKRYTVAATAGDSLSFRLTSMAFDAYLTLHDSLETLLAENDECPASTGHACILEYRAPGTGRYRVEVTTAAAAATGAFTLSVNKEKAPELPQQPRQFSGDTTAINIGATTTDSVVLFNATVNDPNPRDSVRLELELLESSSEFTTVGTHQSAFVGTGQTAWIRATTGLTENRAHHWRARTCDKTLRCSAWVSFGANADGAADFFFNAVAENPVLDAFSLNQFNGATEIPVGGGTGGAQGTTQTVTFRASVTDPDPGDGIVLEVEVKPTNTGFNGTSELYRGASVASGATAATSGAFQAPILIGSNAYHWRARACDQTSRCSDWAAFGNNSDAGTADTDFHVP